MPARLGLENEIGEKGQDAALEIRFGGKAHIESVGGFDLNVILLHAAIEIDLEIAWAKNLPAGIVGDRERQAAVGVLVSEGVHPLALGRRGDHLARVFGERIKIELHRRGDLFKEAV